MSAKARRKALRKDVRVTEAHEALHQAIGRAVGYVAETVLVEIDVKVAPAEMRCHKDMAGRFALLASLQGPQLAPEALVRHNFQHHITVPERYARGERVIKEVAGVLGHPREILPWM